MCELESADLKKVMIGVMSTIENTLKYATRGNENVLYAYIGTPTQKFEQVIKKNAKYAIDNINALNNIWGVTLASDAYVKQYAEDYTVDNIVMATIAD
jgi:aspartate/methionine/tyrosine aminotransferase